MKTQRFILAGLAGVAVAELVVLYRVSKIAARLQAEGVVVQLPVPFSGTLPVHLKPPEGGGGGDTLQLPADVVAMKKSTPFVAAGAAIGAALLVGLVAGD